MSRSGYSDDCENLALYRGRVASAIRGNRGQQLLRDLLAALDAMPTKELIAHKMVDENGRVCALGCVAQKRGRLGEVEGADHDEIGMALNIAECLAAEVEFVNDEQNIGPETDSQRWHRVRAWVVENLR